MHQSIGTVHEVYLALMPVVITMSKFAVLHIVHRTAGIAMHTVPLHSSTLLAHEQAHDRQSVHMHWPWPKSFNLIIATVTVSIIDTRLVATNENVYWHHPRA